MVGGQFVRRAAGHAKSYMATQDPKDDELSVEDES